MKRILPIIAILIFLCSPVWAANYNVTAAITTITMTNPWGLAAGDTLTITENRTNTHLILNGIVGTALAPIVLQNSSGDTRTITSLDSDDYGAIYIDGCQHIKINGVNGLTEGTDYGIEVTDGKRGILFWNDSEDTEMTGVYIHDVSRVGIGMNHNTGTRKTVSNFYFHHCKVKNTGREGMYLGARWEDNVTSNLVENLRVEYCVFENTGWDAIQYSGVFHGTNVIKNNSITDSGTADEEFQNMGIVVNRGTRYLTIYNNEIYNVDGIGIYLNSEGATTAYNNVIHNTGTGSFQKFGIKVESNASSSQIYNNTIAVTADDGIYLNGDDSLIKDNIICGYGANEAIDDDTTAPNAATLTNNRTSVACADQDFTNLATDDFSLTSTSDARNSGSGDSTLTFDIIGTPRPQEDIVDQGAYEYIADPNPEPSDYANYTAWIRLEAADFSGGVTAESEEAPGGSDQVWTLDGSAFNAGAQKLGTNGLDCPSQDHAVLDNADDYWDDDAPAGSFAFWFRPVSLPSATAGFFVVKQNGATSHLVVYCTATGKARIQYYTAAGLEADTVSGSVVFTANTWHFVEIRLSMSGDSIKVDVDNVNAITDTSNITPWQVDFIYLGDYFNAGSSDYHLDSFTISTDVDEDHYESRDSDVWPGKVNTDTVGLTDLGYWDGTTCDCTKSTTISTAGNLPLCHTTEREFNVPPGTEYAPTFTILAGPETADELVCSYAGYEDVAGGTGVIKWNCTLVAGHRSPALKSKATATAIDLKLETAKTGATFTKADPGVVTLTAHGYSDGDTVTISNTNAGECPELEDAYCTITYTDANTFSIGSTTGCTAAETSGCDFQRCPTVFRDINDNYLDPASAPNEDIASLVVSISDAFTICASGCDITAHSDLVSQVDGDVLYTKDHTENLTITASNMVIQGSGYDLTGTVTFNVGADYNVINCLDISGAITDNGSGNIVREHCPVSTQTGPRNYSPFF